MVKAGCDGVKKRATDARCAKVRTRSWEMP